jgi:hypothetical protein
MEELVGHIVLFAGVNETIAREGVGHVLVFLQKRYPGGPPDELIARLSGAQEASKLSQAAPRRGLLGSIVGGIGGAVGGATGDTLAMSSRLLGLGMSQDQLQRFTKQFFYGAERAIGREKTRQMTDPIPGLTRFLWPAG